MATFFTTYFPELVLLGIAAVFSLGMVALARREARKFDEKWGKR